MKTIHKGILNEGFYSMTWNADDGNGNKVDDGIYLLTLDTPDGIQTKRVAVIK